MSHAAHQVRRVQGKLKEWSRLFEDEYGRRPTDDDRYDSATWVALNDKARHYRRLAGEEATPSPLKRSGSRGSRRHLDRSESTESVSRRHSQGHGGSSKSLDRDGSPAMRRPKGRERSSTRDGDGEWSGGGGRAQLERGAQVARPPAVGVGPRPHRVVAVAESQVARPRALLAALRLRARLVGRRFWDPDAGGGGDAGEQRRVRRARGEGEATRRRSSQSGSAPSSASRASRRGRRTRRRAGRTRRTRRSTRNGPRNSSSSPPTLPRTAGVAAAAAAAAVGARRGRAR